MCVKFYYTAPSVNIWGRDTLLFRCPPAHPQASSPYYKLGLSCDLLVPWEFLFTDLWIVDLEHWTTSDAVSITFHFYCTHPSQETQSQASKHARPFSFNQPDSRGEDSVSGTLAAELEALDRHCSVIWFYV